MSDHAGARGSERPFYNRIYDVLVEECGANDDQSNRTQWDVFWSDHHRFNTEYRFIGALGFGGKFWRANGRWYVNCYRENETPERLAMIAAADKRLAALKAIYDEDAVGVLEA